MKGTHHKGAGCYADRDRKKQEEYLRNKEKFGEKFKDLGYICCSEKGVPHSTAFYYNPFKHVLKEAGLPRYTLA